MSSISYLNNCQIGGKNKSRFRNCTSSLNLDHVLSRLACHKKDIFIVHGEEADVPPFACKFRKDTHSDLLAVANEDGDISLHDTSKQNPESFIKSFVAHHNAVFDICWVPDKCQLISGSGDHNAALWDITSYKLISVFKKHNASIKSVDVCHEQSAIFATGSRDGSINVWDTRETNATVHLKPAVVISQAHCRKNTVYSGRKSTQKDPISSVSAVAFQDSNNLASAGVADGIVKIWDLRKTYIPNSKYLPTPKYQMNYSEPGSTGHGCTSLVFDSHYKTLYGCSTNHKIVKFDCHSYTKEVDAYEGFRCTTYFVKLALSGDDKYLLCGSSDDKAYIWKTSKPGLPIVKLGVHSAEVTSVCWSPYDITKLATCGDDNKVAIWKIATVDIDSKNDDIFAVAEPYSESPKNDSPTIQNIARNSTTASNILTKKSPVQSFQTPNKPAARSITSFFSPLTPSSIDEPFTNVQNVVTTTSSEESSPSNKQPYKSPTKNSPPQVLTSSNLVNIDNGKNQSPDVLSSPELKNSSPENKSNGNSFLSSSLSIQNKENAITKISPETVYKTNSTGQTKRKITSRHSTPNVKRKQTESSKKTKGLVTMDKKVTPVRTIMNYFSVALSSDR